MLTGSAFAELHALQPDTARDLVGAVLCKFNGVSDVRSDDAQLLRSAYLDLLYYSYVTLSTLGYGEITPVSRAAQSLAYLEAICGVMYVAVLVSALVGSYGNKRVAQA